MPLTISRSVGASFSYSTLRQRFGESEPRNARRIGLRGQSSRMTGVDRRGHVQVPTAIEFRDARFALRLPKAQTVIYSRHVIAVLTTEGFDSWLRGLKDRQGRLRILERIDRLAHGNPGDTKAIGRGVFELRLMFGPGYRVYYLLDGDRLILLLCGGDKSSQGKDIETAQRLADEWRTDQKGEGS